jgi:hypothetical protein
VPTYACWKLEEDGVVVDLRRIPITRTAAMTAAARDGWMLVEDDSAYRALARELAVRRLIAIGFVREGEPETAADRRRDRFTLPDTPHRATVGERTVRLYVADRGRARFVHLYTMGVHDDRMALVLADLADEVRYYRRTEA